MNNGLIANGVELPQRILKFNCKKADLVTTLMDKLSVSEKHAKMEISASMEVWGDTFVCIDGFFNKEDLK